MKIFSVQTIGWLKLVYASEREEIRIKLVELGHNWFEIKEVEIIKAVEIPKCKDSEM